MGASGYNGIRYALSPTALNFTTPMTATMGKIPRQKPMYVRIWSKVPDTTISAAIKNCRTIAFDGTRKTGCTSDTDLKK